MIYEMRIYTCMPGRLPDLLRRFETVTLAMWEKHGIRQAGFWTTLIGADNNDLTYLLQWESLAERERIWTAFASDPAWIAARSLCHSLSGASRPKVSAERIARSMATQAMTLEWVKCRLPPRCSQMPSSGSAQIFAR